MEIFLIVAATIFYRITMPAGTQKRAPRRLNYRKIMVPECFLHTRVPISA